MISLKKILSIICLSIVLGLVLLPRIAEAEIATTKDWIGFFAITNPPQGDRKADTVNGTSWAYTSNCAQATPGPTAVPKLSDSTGCNIIPNPLPTSGTFEYRMYAYDGENADALIARSSPIPATPAPAAGGPGGGAPCPTQSPNPRVRDGLISAPTVGNNFGNNLGQCASGDQASFAPYKIPTYEDLKSKYYIQSKATKTDATPASGTATQGTIRSALNSYDVVFINGDLNISADLGGTAKTAVIFVEGNLNFSSATFTFGNATSGLVFVVGGDVNIATAVTQIDAVIIAEGEICTAYISSSCMDGATITPKLTINGSLISLKDTVPIKFKRYLGTSGAVNDSNNAAEVINNKPKYLVILRNLMSDTLQKWSEIQ